jgi:hypothetical protein
MTGASARFNDWQRICFNLGVSNINGGTAKTAIADARNRFK